MENIVMHIDVNNAFLSWTAVDLLERGYKIDIRNIESIIGGDESKRHGIVLAKSMVAKRKGVKTAETIRDAKRKCDNLQIFPPDYSLYVKKSNELFNLGSKCTFNLSSNCFSKTQRLNLCWISCKSSSICPFSI